MFKKSQKSYMNDLNLIGFIIIKSNLSSKLIWTMFRMPNLQKTSYFLYYNHTRKSIKWINQNHLKLAMIWLYVNPSDSLSLNFTCKNPTNP
jgi:hypothetical protein